MRFMESFWNAFKVTSAAVGMMALIWFISLGFGVTYELLVGHVPEICKIGSQQDRKRGGVGLEPVGHPAGDGGAQKGPWRTATLMLPTPSSSQRWQSALCSPFHCGPPTSSRMVSRVRMTSTSTGKEASMATPNHSPVLPGRGSARLNDHTQCFETLAGASIPAEWVPPGRTITVLDLLALLTRIKHREKGDQRGAYT